jgi:hypothetical protein
MLKVRHDMKLISQNLTEQNWLVSKLGGSIRVINGTSNKTAGVQYLVLIFFPNKNGSTWLYRKF